MSTTQTITPDAELWHDEWAAALDVLELDLDEAEQLLNDGHAPEGPRVPWAPPVIGGYLPGSLHERARSLRERQLRVAADLTKALILTGLQRNAVRALRNETPAQPVYLDQRC